MSDPENKAGMLMRNLFDTVSDIDDMRKSNTEREFIARDLHDLELIRDRVSRAIDDLRGIHAA